MATKGFIPPRRGHPYFSLNSFNFKMLRIRMWCRIRNYYFGLSLFPFAPLLPSRSITSKRSHLATRFQILTFVLLSGSSLFFPKTTPSPRKLANATQGFPRPCSTSPLQPRNLLAPFLDRRPPLTATAVPRFLTSPKPLPPSKAPTAEPQRGNPAAQRVASGL